MTNLARRSRAKFFLPVLHPNRSFEISITIALILLSESICICLCLGLAALRSGAAKVRQSHRVTRIVMIIIDTLSSPTDRALNLVLQTVFDLKYTLGKDANTK